MIIILFTSKIIYQLTIEVVTLVWVNVINFFPLALGYLTFENPLFGWLE